MSKKLKTKEECGSCKHWSGVPYVYCELGSKIINEDCGSVFVSIPYDPVDCRDKRQAWFNRNYQRSI